jgi:outer membrane murein-binding lipoprotein Lpp
VKRTALLAVLLLAGCGSEAKQQAAKPPRLPRALAHTLASKADAVASALAAGDGCTARTRAAELQQQVISAVNAHRVPRRYQEPLSNGVNDLVSQISCTPPPPVVHSAPPGRPGKPPGHEKHEKHGHGHGHGHKDH